MGWVSARSRTNPLEDSSRIAHDMPLVVGDLFLWQGRDDGGVGGEARKVVVETRTGWSPEEKEGPGEGYEWGRVARGSWDR